MPSGPAALRAMLSPTVAIVVATLARSSPGRSSAAMACQAVAACTSSSPCTASRPRMRFRREASKGLPERMASHSSRADIGVVASMGPSLSLARVQPAPCSAALQYRRAAVSDSDTVSSMALRSRLVDALKACLRARDLTYKDLAAKLRLSEPTVKRMFSQGSVTLERIEQILEVIDLDLQELARLAREGSPGPA